MSYISAPSSNYKEVIKLELTSNFTISASGGGSWSQTGNDLYLTAIAYPSIAKLTTSRIAVVDESTDTLRAYDWDGTDFSQVGNALSITSLQRPCVTALSSTRVAVTDQNANTLTTYDFDGTDWSATGNSYTMTGLGNRPKCQYYGRANEVVICSDGAGGNLESFSFDGTDWTSASNQVAGSTGGEVNLTMLDTDKIALADKNGALETWEFDGTDWTQTGNTLTITGVSNPCISAFATDQVAFVDAGNEDLRVYQFDGTDWAEIGTELNLALVTNQLLALEWLTGFDFAFLDDQNDDLRVYTNSGGATITDNLANDLFDTIFEAADEFSISGSASNNGSGYTVTTLTDGDNMTVGGALTNETGVFTISIDVQDNDVLTGLNGVFVSR